MQQIVEMHHSTLSDNMPQVKKIYKSILDETIQSEPDSERLFMAKTILPERYESSMQLEMLANN